MSRFAYRKQKRGQPGFTLIEMVVALAVAALILVGSAALMHYMVVATSNQSDQTTANLQVQYVSFWIGGDVVQAQTISLGNSTVSGFPLVLTEAAQDGGNYTVTYSVEGMKDKLGRDLLTLSRARAGAGNITVAQYLDPASTQCFQKQSGNGTYMLVLNVTAVVDQKQTSGRYEISPRAGNVTWVSGG